MTNLISARSFYKPNIKMGESPELDLGKTSGTLMKPIDFVLSNLGSESRGWKMLLGDETSETSKEVERMAQEKMAEAERMAQEKMAQKEKPAGMFDKLKKAVGLTSSEEPSQKLSQPAEAGESEYVGLSGSTVTKKEKPVPYIFMAFAKSTAKREPEAFDANLEPAKTSSNWERPITNFEKDIKDVQKQAKDAQRKEAVEAQKNAPINNQNKQVVASTESTRKEIVQMELEIATMTEKQPASKNQIVARPAATKSIWYRFFAWLFGWK